MFIDALRITNKTKKHPLGRESDVILMFAITQINDSVSLVKDTGRPELAITQISDSVSLIKGLNSPTIRSRSVVWVKRTTLPFIFKNRNVVFLSNLLEST